MIDYVVALLKPSEGLKIEMIQFMNETADREKWTFQIMSMEQLLNDKYAVNSPNIRIETLNATAVEPLGDRYTGNSYLGTRTSNTSWFIPTKEQALEATGLSDHFVVYADTQTIAANAAKIAMEIEYYKFASLRWQLRDLNDQINNVPESATIQAL
jgi:hypothetical protein